jgi:hypothetical protein
MPMVNQHRKWRAEGASNVDRYEGKDGDDADEEEEASLADDGSTQNLED